MKVKKKETGAEPSRKAYTLATSFRRDWQLWVLLIPAILYIAIFCYLPMGGLVMAFQDVRPGKGVFGSPWVGMKWIKEFVTGYYFPRLMRNTFVLSFLPLLIGFPITLMFALAVNELRNKYYKKAVQFTSYFPYFISSVVVIGIAVTALDPNTGIINGIIRKFGGEGEAFLSKAKYFPWIYTIISVWKSFGFNSILYLAALSSVDAEIYESAKLDGVNKWQELWYITLPAILPTVIIVLLLGLGGLMRTGFEEIFLLYNESTYETADVISTYVYRQGIINGRVSFGTAVGLFNSLISFILLVIFNKISKKVTEVSLW